MQQGQDEFVVEESTAAVAVATTIERSVRVKINAKNKRRTRCSRLVDKYSLSPSFAVWLRLSKNSTQRQKPNALSPVRTRRQTKFQTPAHLFTYSTEEGTQRTQHQRSVKNNNYSILRNIKTSRPSFVYPNHPRTHE